MAASKLAQMNSAENQQAALAYAGSIASDPALAQKYLAYGSAGLANMANISTTAASGSSILGTNKDSIFAQYKNTNMS